MLNTSLLYTSLLNASLLNTIARCRIIAVPALQDAGDWMTAFRSAIDIFEGRAVALTGLPCRDDELSNELSALLTSYAEQVFSYLTSAESHADEREVRQEFERVGRTAIEFCVRVRKQELLFGTVLPQFQAHKQTGKGCCTHSSSIASRMWTSRGGEME